jgi:DNA-binding CsgD family transcriptional regulator
MRSSFCKNGSPRAEHLQQRHVGNANPGNQPTFATSLQGLGSDGCNCPAGWEQAVRGFAVANRLSRREAQLLELAVAGLNNKEAAAALGCQRPTVSTYWNRIFSKTGVRTQRDIMASIIRRNPEAL